MEDLLVKIDDPTELGARSEDYSLPIFSFENFSFRYAEHLPFALKDINLNIHKSEIILVGGKSGAGKSTLSHAISGRIPFNITGQMRGKLSLFGQDIWGYSPQDISKKVSVVFQNAEEQLVTFSVFDEIAFAAENLCIDEEEIRNRVLRVAADLDISDLLHRSIYSLSGGEKQKVILAANLILEPKILILDEPLAFLDEDGTRLLINQLQKIHLLNKKLTIIIIEHRLRPFYPILSRILLLNQVGQLIFDGNPVNYEEFSSKQEIPYLRDDAFHKSHILPSLGSSMENIIRKPCINDSNLIQLDNISFHYPSSNGKTKLIFNNFSLNVKKGEFLGIIGDNGSGKTTLLYLIAQILSPTRGRLLFEGIPYEELDLDSFFPRIGFIFQNPENQLFMKTTGEEIIYAPSNFSENSNGNSANSTKNNFEILSNPEILEDYIHLINENRGNLGDMKMKNPFCLSWGQKRRLNLASIFSYNPDILLIDEPFIGQDADSMNKIFEMLAEMNSQGTTIVMISHDRDILMQKVDRIVNLDDIICPDDFKNPIAVNHSDSLGDPLKMYNSPSKSKGVKKVKKAKRLEEITKFNFDWGDGESWLHNLNPSVKILFLIIYSLMLFQQSSIIILGLCFLATFAVGKSAKIASKDFLRKIRMVIYLTIVYIPLNTLFDAENSLSDEVLFYFFSANLPVRRIALYYGIRTGLIILNLFSSAILFTQTTAPKHLVYSLIDAKIPYRYAFAFMIGLRYIPLVRSELNTIEIAQTMRGAKIKKGTSAKRIYQHLMQRITTLLISILRKAKTTAISIDARGFGSNPTRTNLAQITWSQKDSVLLLVVVLMLSSFVLNAFGFFTFIPIPSLYSIFF